MPTFSTYWAGLATAALADDPILTAVDADTGQIQIGGVEVGDTGERMLTNADLGSPANLSGFVWFRRVGNVVCLRQGTTTLGASWVNDTATDNVYTIPSGFRPATYSGILRQPAFRNGSTGATTTITITSTYLQYRDSAAATNAIGEGAVTYLTEDAWPSSLPGSAA